MIGDCESSQQLLRLATGRSAGERMDLATSLIDLLEETELNPSEREAALIDDILNKLISDFETAVRRELADRLARLELAPHEVIVALANDEIDAAKPLLTQSSALRDQDLIEIIHDRSRQHQMSIALRELVSKTVSDALVETSDEAIITSLLSNNNAQISDATLAYLVGESRRVDSYQEPLVRREDLGDELVKQIYDFVAKALRNRILKRFDLDPVVLDGELIGLADDLLADTARSANETPNDDAPERLAKALASAKEITPEFLVEVLRAGKINLFEAMIGQLTGLDTHTLGKLLYDTNGKALAAVCRAMGIPKKQFIEVYLLIRRSQTKSRTTPTREVATVVRYFDRIAPANALEALAHWRGGVGAGATETVDRHVR